MNRSLFRSPFVLVPVVAIAAWLGLLFLWPDLAAGSSRGLRLGTGIAALVSMLLALAYVLRKYMHKYGYSPEFKLKVAIDRMERAETRVHELRREILRGQHGTKRAVEAQVARILREEGVHRVLVAQVLEAPVKPGEPGKGTPGPRFTIKVTKAFLLGRAAKWLHLHLYLSLAFAAAVLAHGGDGWDSPLGLVLLGSSLIVVATGVVGIVLWALGPAWLTARERDLSIEEAFVLRESFQRKLAELTQKLDGDLKAAFTGPDDGGARARALLAALPKTDAARRVLLQDALVLQGQWARVDSEFRVLWRTRLSFMGWRAVHLPAALVLAVAVAAHLLSIAIY
ncbi:MAG: hypothetical protein IPK67_12285 [Planctomycetes bacterium]|nr:hypothetical protein [Planctomycetota bacterium]